MNREEWLTVLLTRCQAELFEPAGLHFENPVRVTCGFPSQNALGRKTRRVGECWPAKASTDGHEEIFVSPLKSDPIEVGEIVVHELIHATGINGHRGQFKRAMALVGLEGKATSTDPSAELAAQLAIWAAEIGSYPHGTLSPQLKEKKVGSSRFLKASCIQPNCPTQMDGGFVVRVTRKWIDLFPAGDNAEGITLACPGCGSWLAIEQKDDDD